MKDQKAPFEQELCYTYDGYGMRGLHGVMAVSNWSLVDARAHPHQNRCGGGGGEKKKKNPPTGTIFVSKMHGMGGEFRSLDFFKK